MNETSDDVIGRGDNQQIPRHPDTKAEPKTFASSTQRPLRPIETSRRALEDEASSVHEEGVVVDPATGATSTTTKITTSLLYQVPSACGQYRLRRPTATVIVNLMPPGLSSSPSSRAKWALPGASSPASLANPSVCPSPHPTVLTLSGRWTRAMKYRQRTTKYPSSSQTTDEHNKEQYLDDAEYDGQEAMSVVDREIEVFHQETTHRNRTMHGATLEGVEPSPMVVQHRLGVDNGISSIDLTTFNQRFPVQGMVSDGYRLAATLSNPVMLLMGNHTQVSAPYHLPGGTSASALPCINAIHIYWTVTEAAAPRLGGNEVEDVGGGASSGGAEERRPPPPDSVGSPPPVTIQPPPQPSSNSGEPMMEMEMLDRLRRAIQREMAEQQEDEQSDDDVTSPNHPRRNKKKTPIAKSENYHLIEEAITKQRIYLESQGLGKGRRPPCEVPYLFCGTDNGHIIEHSLSNRFMQWLTKKQVQMTATPIDRFFRKWERKLRREVTMQRGGSRMDKTSARQTCRTAERSRSRSAPRGRGDHLTGAVARAHDLLETAEPVEEWIVDPTPSAAASSSSPYTTAVRQASGAAEIEEELSTSGDDTDWDRNSRDDLQEDEVDDTALDLLSRPGIPCRCLYAGSVPIVDLTVFRGFQPGKGDPTRPNKATAFTMIALLSTSELLLFRASDPVWAVPTSTLVPFRRVNLIVPVSIRLFDKFHTWKQNIEDGDQSTPLDPPKGPAGCIPPEALPGSASRKIPHPIIGIKLVSVLAAEFDDGSTCVETPTAVSESVLIETIQRLNVLGPTKQQPHRSKENTGVSSGTGCSPSFSQFSISNDGSQLALVSPFSKVVCGFSLHQLLKQQNDDDGQIRSYIAEPMWVHECLFPPTSIRSHQAPPGCCSEFIVATDHEVLSLCWGKKLADDSVEGGCSQNNTELLLLPRVLLQTQFAKTLQIFAQEDVDGMLPLSEARIETKNGENTVCATQPNGFISGWQRREAQNSAGRERLLVCDSAAPILEGAISTVNSVGQGGSHLRNPSLADAALRLGHELRSHFGEDRVSRGLSRIQWSPCHPTIDTSDTHNQAILLNMEGERRNMIVGFDIDAGGERCVVSTSTYIAEVPIPPAGTLKTMGLNFLNSAIARTAVEIEIHLMKMEYRNVVSRLQGDNIVVPTLHRKLTSLFRVEADLREQRSLFLARYGAGNHATTIRCPRGHPGMQLCHVTKGGDLQVPPAGSEEAYSALFYDTMEAYGTDEGNHEGKSDETYKEEEKTFDSLLKAYQISAFRPSRTSCVCDKCGLDVQRAIDEGDMAANVFWCGICGVSLCTYCSHLAKPLAWDHNDAV